MVELPGFIQSEKFPVRLSGNDPSCSVYFAVNTATQIITLNNNSLAISSMKIYPNPASGLITIDLGKLNDELAWMTIYSTQGNLVMQQKLDAPKMLVDLARLVAGTYLVKVSVGKETQTKVIIKE